MKKMIWFLGVAGLFAIGTLSMQAESVCASADDPAAACTSKKDAACDAKKDCSDASERTCGEKKNCG